MVQSYRSDRKTNWHLRVLVLCLLSVSVAGLVPDRAFGCHPCDLLTPLWYSASISSQIAYVGQDVTVTVTEAQDMDWDRTSQYPNCEYWPDMVKIAIYKDGILYYGPVTKGTQDIVCNVSFSTTGSHSILLKVYDVHWYGLFDDFDQVPVFLITVLDTSYGITYDANGNTTVTNANGTSTVYTYDERYRLKQVKNKDKVGSNLLGAVVDYQMDGVGNRTKMYLNEQDVLSKRTLYTYDDMNRLESATYPGSETGVTFTYDWVGNLGGYTYNIADMLQPYTYYGTGALHIGGSPSRTYTYDSRDLLLTVGY